MRMPKWISTHVRTLTRAFTHTHTQSHAHMHITPAPCSSNLLGSSSTRLRRQSLGTGLPCNETAAAATPGSPIPGGMSDDGQAGGGAASGSASPCRSRSGSAAHHSSAHSRASHGGGHHYRHSHAESSAPSRTGSAKKYGWGKKGRAGGAGDTPEHTGEAHSRKPAPNISSRQGGPKCVDFQMQPAIQAPCTLHCPQL